MYLEGLDARATFLRTLFNGAASIVTPSVHPALTVSACLDNKSHRKQIHLLIYGMSTIFRNGERHSSSLMCINI